MTLEVKLEGGLLQAERAYLDFTFGVRAHNMLTLLPQVSEVFDRGSKDYERQHGRPPEALAEVDHVVGRTLPYRFNRYLEERGQRMMWEGYRRAEPYLRPAIDAELWGNGAAPLGTLEIDPDFKLPEYYATVEFHLQPGSYFTNDLNWIMYRYAGVRTLIAANRKSVAEHLGEALPPELPAGTPGLRILNLGCGSGRSTLPLLELFPDAEVWGIDLAANLLRNAHRLAERAGKRVHYAQRAAEATGFEDNQFDLIVAYTLQHELPQEPMRAVVAEAYRILKPGGWFLNGDVIPYRHMPPLMRYLWDWQVDHFGEPYVREAGQLDLPSVFREVGFRTVREQAPEGYPNGLHYPWWTIGMK